MAPSQQGNEGRGGMFGAFIPLILIFVIFYFLLIRPQQKQAKRHRELIQNLKRGDLVLTSGGLHGRIEHISDSVVTITLPPDNVKVKMTRNYIVGLLSPQSEQSK
jgi:preprotein translocase subunit YajC